MNQISKNENEEKRNYTKIVITNSNQYLPSDLSIQAYSLLIPIYIKETCFGLVITGTIENVNSVCQKLQELDIDNLLCAIELSVDDERKNILMRLSKIKSIHKYETNHQLL